jgi:hypothetical protein
MAPDSSRLAVWSKPSLSIEKISWGNISRVITLINCRKYRVSRVYVGWGTS